MAKRKDKALCHAKSNAKRTKTAATATTDTHQQPFRFLELPAELRTEILALAACEGGKAFLSSRSRGNLSSADSISLANKQLRHEYLAALYGHARETKAQVLDFDFRHIVTFFNKLNAVELKAIASTVSTDSEAETTPTQQHSGDRTFKILIGFKPDFLTGFATEFERADARCAVRDLLVRWIKRRTRPDRKGFETQLSYVYTTYQARTEARSWLLDIPNTPNTPSGYFPEEGHDEVMEMSEAPSLTKSPWQIAGEAAMKAFLLSQM